MESVAEGAIEIDFGLFLRAEKSGVWDRVFLGWLSVLLNGAIVVTE